ncbi:hypothetical protein [Hallella absiana]|uniref:hypothetical protein n=1 Tax=Hallella absiana TaxID=2925336 RepID=UPI0021C9CE89|nr:hypothetical protein [Hallella absiana]
MEFSTIAFVLLGVGLPVFYLAMIIHDIYFVKDAEELMPKPEEVEVDISDEAGQFQPIFIDKDAAPKTAKPVQEVKAEQPRQTNTADQPKVANETDHPIVSAPKEKDKNEAENKEKNKDKKKSNEDHNDKAKTSAVQPDNVLEPVIADKEARKRIQELVRIRRQQMHAEELAAAKEKSNQQPEVIVETQEHRPEDASTSISASPVVYVSADDDDTPKATSSKSMPTKKQRPIPAYFYYKAKVAPQDTVYCGGQTAEKLSEEVKRVSADQVELITRMIDAEWEETDAEPRELDEDEKIAIEMAKQRSPRQDVPTVNF